MRRRIRPAGDMAEASADASHEPEPRKI